MGRRVWVGEGWRGEGGGGNGDRWRGEKKRGIGGVRKRRKAGSDKGK